MDREITVDLGDGDQAIMLTEMRHGTQRRIEEITRPFLIFPETKLNIGKDNAQIKAIIASDEVEIDWTKFDSNAIDDACILGQVISWSFGEQTAGDLRNEPGDAPVDQATLNGLPETKYKILKAKVDEIFGGALPLAQGGNVN